MADLENPKTVTVSTELNLNQTAVPQTPAAGAISESPSHDLFQTRPVKKLKRAMPHTYRRPTYLRYIEYV